MSASGRREVGIDVSKVTLDVVILPAPQHFVVSNDEAGIDALIGKFANLPEALVVLEVTGSFERPVVAALAVSGAALFVVNPRQASDFAKVTGQLAKTDALDALVLACFTQAIRPTPRTIPDEEAREFGEILARRRQSVRMLTAGKNRLGASTSRAVHSRIEAHIRWLKKELARTDRDLDETIEQSSTFRANETLLRSVSGVGPVLCRTLLAELPELGSFSPKERSALVDVASLNRNSGTLRGGHTMWGGRARVREALYMEALSTCRRKLLTIHNAVMRDCTLWKYSHVLTHDSSKRLLSCLASFLRSGFERPLPHGDERCLDYFILAELSGQLLGDGPVAKDQHAICDHC